MTTELLQQTLDALNDSLDCVATEYAIYLENYGDYSSHKARIDMLKIGVDKHIAAIKALEVAIAQPEQPAPPECKTEEEKTAYAFGFYKGLEHARNIAQPEQTATSVKPAAVQGEPVGWLDEDGDYFPARIHNRTSEGTIPVYTTAQPAPKQGEVK